MTDTTEPPEDWFERIRWYRDHPTPLPPSYCFTCGVRLSPERAGCNLRCVPCWDALIAAQPALRGESAT